MFGSVADSEWWHNRTQLNLNTFNSNNNSVLDLCKSYFDFSDITSDNPLSLNIDPEGLNIYYEDDDLDLIPLHNIVRDKIIRILILLKNYDRDVYNLCIKINSNQFAPIDVRGFKSDIEKLTLLKNKYEAMGDIWKTYKDSILPILINYTPLILKENSVSQNNIMDKETIKNRKKYIKQYIDTVNKIGILNLKYYQIVTSLPSCPSCMETLREDLSSEENGYYTCNCGFSESTIKHLSEYHDPTRFGSLNLTTDINLGRIKDWIDEYLCRKMAKYNKVEMFEKFDQKCIECNFPNRFDVIRNLTYQPSMSVIITLLRLTKNTDLYSAKHQIRHEFYNYPKPTLSDVQETTIIKLYVDFQNKYNEIGERKHSVHIEILACVFLIIVGIDINPNDFKNYLSSDTIEYSHNSVFKVLKALGFEESKIPNVREIFG